MIFNKTSSVSEDEVKSCVAIIDAWSTKIPFCPKSNLGSAVDWSDALKFANYTVWVESQIEKRWTEDHQAPYVHQDLPDAFIHKDRFDIWAAEFEVKADFQNHRQSLEIFETRKVIQCKPCSGTGSVDCVHCKGRGRISCSTCTGSGQRKCNGCRGSGRVTKNREQTRQISCNSCRGRGYYTSSSGERRCSTCGGKGWKIESYFEQYHVSCGQCAGHGRVPCEDCGSTGQVDCLNCDATGRITCTTCEGHGNLLTWTTIERTETYVCNNQTCVSTLLPVFKLVSSPVSNLRGESIFAQDELNKLENVEISDGDAIPMIIEKMDECRKNHVGHIIRQRLIISDCPVIAMAGDCLGRAFKIYVNPKYELVEDIDGPISNAIKTMDALAKKHFELGEYEKAYHFNLKAICIGESTEAGEIRNKIRLRLWLWYIVSAALTYILFAALLRVFFHVASWKLAVTVVPLSFAIWLFASDFSLRLRDKWARVFISGIFSLTMLTTCAQLGEPWQRNWLMMLTGLGLGFVWIYRKSERRRRSQSSGDLRRGLFADGDVRKIEAYVNGFDSTDGYGLRICSIIFIVCSISCLTFVMRFRAERNQESVEPVVLEDATAGLAESSPVPESTSVDMQK